MTILQIARQIHANESEYTDETGFLNREYVMERFSLTRENWRDLISLLELAEQGMVL
jgi:hypothetical protein